MKQLILFSLILPWLTVSALAANINAASCSSADVQTAINSASSGDSVTLPSCAATPWTSAVTWANKSLTIQGQTACTGTPATSCSDKTVLQDNATNGMFSWTNNAPNLVTIEGITCVNCGEQNGTFQPIGSGTGNFDVTFRITNNHFVMVASRAIIPLGTYGLIDHNLFDSPGGSLQSISITGSPTGNDFGFTPWTKPFTPGTNNAVYVEDNTFNYGTGVGDDAIDAYNGARLVIRHNNFINAHIGFHGTDSGGRSALMWETYNNTFTNNSSQEYDMETIRGGTGFVFNNTYGGSQNWGYVDLKDYRACGYDSTNWGSCNGAKWGLESLNHTLSPAFQVSTSGPAFWCSQNRDKQCQVNSDCGGSNTCSAYMDGAADPQGYPCRDQPGMAPGQISAPVYLWNNTGGNGAINDNSTCNTSHWIAANRDYYNYTSSFTGASGTGQGPLSARPSTCTPMVAYFATDSSTLYQCASTNSWAAYYTPYTYPHPLQGGGPPPSQPAPPTGSRPAPPTGLSGVVQ